MAMAGSANTLLGTAVAETWSASRGMQIGTVGNIGNAQAKGTHLHFEVRVYNGDSILAVGRRAVDPEAWLKGELREPRGHRS